LFAKNNRLKITDLGKPVKPRQLGNRAETKTVINASGENLDAQANSSRFGWWPLGTLKPMQYYSLALPGRCQDVQVAGTVSQVDAGGSASCFLG
jgi:hypothetical protein